MNEDDTISNKAHCLKCGYEWDKRISRRPKCCPNCKSRTWDVKKTDEV